VSTCVTKWKTDKETQLINKKCTTKLQYRTRSTYRIHKYRKCKIVLLFCAMKNRYSQR